MRGPSRRFQRCIITSFNDLFGFMASMMFGAMAYTVQTNLSLIGLSDEDRKKAASDRLSDEKIAMAGFQRAGASSLFRGRLTSERGY